MTKTKKQANSKQRRVPTEGNERTLQANVFHGQPKPSETLQEQGGLHDQFRAILNLGEEVPDDVIENKAIDRLQSANEMAARRAIDKLHGSDDWRPGPNVWRSGI